ncbi:MAG: hypothetical protein KGO01_23185, partial [Burkholderiales bacterium]|nr:hypothetical protein [Burkholderiales bacterium]
MIAINPRGGCADHHRRLPSSKRQISKSMPKDTAAPPTRTPRGRAAQATPQRARTARAARGAKSGDVLDTRTPARIESGVAARAA